MTGEVIKSFLMGLGFDVDDSSLSKFNKAITSATLKVTALYAATNVMAAAIAKGISGISEDFEKMGYEFKIIAPQINRALYLRNELIKAYRAAGINIQKTVVESVKLNLSITKTRFALDAIYKSVGSKFFGLLTKQSDLFRQKIYQNMPKIQATLEKFVKVVFKAVEVVTILGARLWSILTRVYDFFVMLDKATDGWSTIILGVIAAWKLLNLEFLATPLGLIISGLVAILALFDDFKTWKEGGKSLFDWSAVAPSIEAVYTIFESMLDVLREMAVILGHLYTGQFGKLREDLSAVLADLNSINTAMDKIARSFGIFDGALNLRDKIDNAFFSLFGNGNAAANIQNNPAARPLANPIGGNVQSSLTNQNVNQQTSINIVGSADAHATARATANEQARVNQDLSRNMKGATR